MSDYKPGTVASVRPYIGKGEEVAIHTAAGTWSTANGSFLNVTDIRPLVVLDLPVYNDPASMLRTIANHFTVNADRSLLLNIADQIEEQTKPPKPPKPAEPTGLGAVVEASNGMLWVAARPLGCDISARWRSWPAGMWHPYEDIDAVRVLSEGVDA